MLDTFIRHATTTLRVLWWMTIVGTATTFGTLYGWQGYGLDGAIGFGLVGFTAGAAFAALFPEICLELFGRVFLGVFQLLWD
ncbi:hypothetical protein [Ensifer adhaerens]|jgi:hypothetical protein|uniref:Uncharacterized protein n=1 Tax=Ensifer adhaerens TaxID=106592 RepID=A0A9Q8Y4K8_ENSAD|nr:hypothetical protein [Ensifer adhaerens]USJ21751.1 hypothetical protein NE863_10480 [Ensifer adhaerens]